MVSKILKPTHKCTHLVTQISLIFVLLALSTSASLAQNFDEINNEELHQHRGIESLVASAEQSALSLALIIQKRKVQFRNDYLAIYLAIYTSIFSFILSILFSLIGYRFSDKMSPFSQVLTKTALLTAACGLGVGICIAALEVPPNHPTRLSLLLLLIITGGTVSFLTTRVAFLVMRARILRIARLEGRPYSERMRQG
jgi:hypothetical protein